MKAENPLSVRKRPKQERAQVTVRSILQATEKLVRAHGFSKVGTRRIAEVAGVTVGSVYQYFPTYEAILLTWYEEVSAQAAHDLKVGMVKVAHDDFRVAAPYILELLLTILEKNSLVLIDMVRECKDVANALRMAAFEDLFYGITRMYFTQRFEFNREDIEIHIFFVKNIVFHCMYEFIKNPPESLDRRRFLDRLSDLVVAYLEHNLDKSQTSGREGQPAVDGPSA